MKIASGKMSGKRLDNYIIDQIRSSGSVQVAALSSLGIDKIHAAGQRVANKTGFKLQGDPSQGEIEISEGSYRLGIIFTFTVQK